MSVSNSRTMRNSIGNSLQSRSLILMCSVLVLSACGSKSDDDNVLVYQGLPADSVTTETLQRNASAATSESLGNTMTGLVQTMNGSAALAKMVSFPGLGNSAASSADGVFNDPTEPGPLVNSSFESRARTETSGTFATTLGLSGQATSTRAGNTITIDPDERELCLDQVESDDQGRCEQLLADLMVRIDADSDKSGTINYFFRNQSVASIQYSPVAGSYELHLSGLHSMMVRMSELDSQYASVPQTMTGKIKFNARVLNASRGAEAGSLSIAVSEAIKIVDSASGTDISVAPSTLLSLSANSGNGTASVELGIGALAFTTPNDELAGSPLQKLAMAGLTARADMSSNGNVLTVSNVGLGNGPLTLSVDSVEILRATLDTFGFTVNQNTNTVTLNTNLNYSAALNNALGAWDAFAPHSNMASVTVAADSGTQFTELSPGLMRVEQGGPLTLDYALSENGNSASGTVNVQLGQCFGELLGADAPVSAVVCE